jgi:soluble lytic murein transglycosylase-like protein
MRPVTILAAIAFAASGAAFSTQTAADYQPVPPVTVLSPVVISGLQSEFQKEQSMHPSELMDRWAPLIKEASRRFGVAEAWIRAVMRKQSGGRTMPDENQPMASDAGAMGIMQVMPDTYNDMRAQ